MLKRSIYNCVGNSRSRPMWSGDPKSGDRVAVRALGLECVPDLASP
jgi:hypothetical protein